MSPCLSRKESEKRRWLSVSRFCFSAAGVGKKMDVENEPTCLPAACAKRSRSRQTVCKIGGWRSRVGYARRIGRVWGARQSDRCLMMLELHTYVHPVARFSVRPD